MTKLWIKTLLLTLSLASIADVHAEAEIYRYKDKDGKINMTSNLTPEATQVGYEVLNSRGMVVRVVPPPKTAEQLAQEQKELEAKQLRDKAEAEQKKAQQLQAQKDEILLKAFMNVDDMVRSRDEKIASVEILEGIVHENINRLQKQLNEAKNNAKYYQEKKQPLPDALNKTIEQTQREISENEQFLKNKAEEKKMIMEKFATLIARFRQIQQQQNQGSTASPQPAAQMPTQTPSSQVQTNPAQPSVETAPSSTTPPTP